jgi:hypothetical protein
VSVSDEREPLTFEQAEAMLPDGDTIHTYTNPAPFVLVGADWARAQVLAAIRKYGAQKAGPVASASGHALCIDRTGGWVFVETRPPNPAEAAPVGKESDTKT